MTNRTKQSKISKQELEKMKNYLAGYKLSRELLTLEGYEREFLGSHTWASERPGELSLARARMFEIRHFILSLPNSTEKILLYLHYIDCEPIERCADILNFSRSSAFRLKNKALELACKFKADEPKEENTGISVSPPKANANTSAPVDLNTKITNSEENRYPSALLPTA